MCGNICSAFRVWLFFVKEKTIKYGLKKIWGLLQIYWISLFTLFIPAALLGGWKITIWKLIVQMFGLLPNLNWFAWYVFFYIFCVLVMPIICRCEVFRFHPYVNLLLMVVVPYIFEVVLHTLPNYETNTIIHDLFSCFLYFPCFLIGYWMAENKIIEKSKQLKVLRRMSVCVIGIIIVFAARICVRSVAGILLDVIYASIIIILIVNLFEKNRREKKKSVLSILGKYSTGMWFFHAVFFSTYVCDWFRPMLKLVSWPLLMFVWLVFLSFGGAFIYQKVLNRLRMLPKLMKGVKNGFGNYSDL